MQALRRTKNTKSLAENAVVFLSLQERYCAAALCLFFWLARQTAGASRICQFLILPPGKIRKSGESARFHVMAYLFWSYFLVWQLLFHDCHLWQNQHVSGRFDLSQNLADKIFHSWLGQTGKSEENLQLEVCAHNSSPFVSDWLFLILYLSFQTPTKQSHNGSFPDFTPDSHNAGRSHQGRRQKWSRYSWGSLCHSTCQIFARPLA